ncbi:MAG: M1 family metallopeptidase [Gemmatimonadota bacterium]|nr:M1 family metallopeptidase [Gemmatimonadota bacterium]
MKKFTLLATVLAACARTAPVLLPTVRMEMPVPAGVLMAEKSNAPVKSDSVYRTERDDPFYTTNRADWPGPNLFHSSSGAPGPEYWQQRADYRISATLDTAAKTIAGTVAILYTNNSPDTLRYVWLQLDQNVYQPGSEGSVLFGSDSRWGVSGFQGGYSLRDVAVNGSAVAPRVNGTMMRLDLPAPLKPKGGTVSLSMAFSFRVPDHGSDRMGRDGPLYEIAQWYPRMAVYDDVRGWNTDQYLGQGEFYLEYGDIEYAITAPAGFTVAGSGTLENTSEVLTPKQRNRLARAAQSNEVIGIITADEAKAPATMGTRTWRFSAKRVRDAAWAAAPDFRWDATSWNGVLCQAFYESPKAGKAWESAAEQTQWTIRHFSETFYPYPYPQATSVAGPVSGMEYPMFVMVEYGSDDPASIFAVLNHEHGHEWFPMVVGSNERRYAWMDEGFNTYIDAFALEARNPGTNFYHAYLGVWQTAVRTKSESPLMTAPDRVDVSGLSSTGYRKPGVVLLTLRNHVVGPELFDASFRQYIHDWAFKHPTPGDFFRSIENGTGRDLSWFWRSFFYSTDVLDIGIDSVSQRGDGAGSTMTISLRRFTSIPFPVALRVAYSDGTAEDFKLPVEIWARSDRYDAELPAKGKVVGARLWPDPSVPDWNPGNDTWGFPPPADADHPVTRGR